MNAKELYEAGQLDDAISALNDDVRKNPTDRSLRGFLAELLCFAGNPDRADTLLETMLHQDPDAADLLNIQPETVRASPSAPRPAPIRTGTSLPDTGS